METPYIIPSTTHWKKNLNNNEIGKGTRYPIPTHLQKAYKYLGYQKGYFPTAEELVGTCLSIPQNPDMSDEGIEDETKAIKRFYA